MIQIIPLGGYQEVGKNMTAIRVDNDIVILDIGLHLPNYIKFTDDEDDVRYYSSDKLRAAGAIPDDTFLWQYKDNVKAILTTHAHLDHIGAIPYVANGYDCPIICTRFASEVLKTICKDEKIKLRNKISVLDENGRYKLTKDIEIEFVNITHSTPQTVIIALHTKYGTVIYANDYKFDNHPTIGRKPNYKRFEQLGKEGVLCLITDCLYAWDARKMPGEKIVRDMLREVIVDTDSTGKAVIISTFSSHLARLKSIVDFSKKLNRKIVFLGRSLSKYVEAGKNAGILDLSKDAEIVKYSRQVRNKLNKIEKEGSDKYVLVVTGHQGEPKAILSRMANKELPFKFKSGDHIIFSCITIPSAINIANREVLENTLKKNGVCIFKDIHFSGHAAREDLRDFINMLKPKYLVPTHAEKKKVDSFVDLALEIGYDKEDVYVLKNFDVLDLV
jgi:ribonuclease J